MKYLLLPLLLISLLSACKETKETKETPLSESGRSQDEEGRDTPSEMGYSEKGMEYAMAVQASLGKSLQKQIQESGIEDAIVFCKVEALPITDSLARQYGAGIRRISDKPRNLINRAGAEEMKFISHFKAELSGGKPMEPLVVRQGNETNFYYPILTNNLCLKCHGSPEEDIRPGVLTVLEELYPEDQAMGYTSNELRGLWKVSFTEN